MVDLRVAFLREFHRPLPVFLVRFLLGFQQLSKSLSFAVPYPGALFEITFAFLLPRDILGFFSQTVESSTSSYFAKDFFEDLARVIPERRFIEGADANWRLFEAHPALRRFLLLSQDNDGKTPFAKGLTYAKPRKEVSWDNVTFLRSRDIFLRNFRTFSHKCYNKMSMRVCFCTPVFLHFFSLRGYDW